MTLCGITHGSACGKIHFQWFSLSLCFNAVLVFKYKFSENHFKVINSTANNALHAYMLLHWLHHCSTNTASFRHINHVRHQKKHCSTTAINSIHYPHSTVILFRLSLFLPGASMIWHSTRSRFGWPRSCAFLAWLLSHSSPLSASMYSLPTLSHLFLLESIDWLV